MPSMGNSLTQSLCLIGKSFHRTAKLLSHWAVHQSCSSTLFLLQLSLPQLTSSCALCVPAPWHFLTVPHALTALEITTSLLQHIRFEDFLASLSSWQNHSCPVCPGGSQSLFLEEGPVVRDAKALRVTPATQSGVPSSCSLLLHQQEKEHQLGPHALHPHLPEPSCHSECAQGCR